jgi:hypothetical protein
VRSIAASAIARSWIARPVEEDRDVTVGYPPLGCTDQDVTELRHVVTREHLGLDRVYELTIVARLLRVIPEVVEDLLDWC